MKNFKIILIVLIIIILIFLLRNKEGMINASKVAQIKKCLQNKAGGNYHPGNIVCKDGSLPSNKQQIIDRTQLNYNVDQAIGTAVVGQSPKPSLQTLQQDATREKCLVACGNVLDGYHAYYWNSQTSRSVPDKKEQMGRCVNSCVNYNSTCSLIYSKYTDYYVSGWAAMNSNDVGCE